MDPGCGSWKDSGSRHEQLSPRVARAAISTSKLETFTFTSSSKTSSKYPEEGFAKMSTSQVPRGTISPLPPMDGGDRPPMALVSPSRSHEQVVLPPIRVAVPEIHLRESRLKNNPRAFSAPLSPTSGPQVSDSVSIFQSPSHKRRRQSVEEDEQDSRYTISHKRVSIDSSSRSGRKSFSMNTSPTFATRRGSGLSAVESWTGSRRTSLSAQPRNLPLVASPPLEVSGISRWSEWKPKFRLPPMEFDRASIPSSRGRSNIAEYSFNPSRSGAQTQLPQSDTYEAPMSYQTGGAQYGYQQPRGQSFPGPAGSERSPFSAGTQHYLRGSLPYGLDQVDSATDPKQRKRRGNLPKETTDKLRAWFSLHLQHPYPTEDEKQDLMSQTGLQMNQISNWFINARRRQLPTMMQNAQAERNARDARAPGATEPTEGLRDYNDERGPRSANSMPSSESDDGASTCGQDQGDQRLRENSRFSGLGSF